MYFSLDPHARTTPRGSNTMHGSAVPYLKVQIQGKWCLRSRRRCVLSSRRQFSRYARQRPLSAFPVHFCAEMPDRIVAFSSAGVPKQLHPALRLKRMSPRIRHSSTTCANYRHRCGQSAAPLYRCRSLSRRRKSAAHEFIAACTCAAVMVPNLPPLQMDGLAIVSLHVGSSIVAARASPARSPSVR